MSNIAWTTWAETPESNVLAADFFVGLRAGVNVAFNATVFPFRLSHAGNPNGSVLGNSGDLCINTTQGKTMYVCTTTGSSGSAVWTLVNPLLPGSAGIGSLIGGDYSSTATANYAFAFGLSTASTNAASGIASIAWGDSNASSGHASIAVGISCTAAGDTSFAGGNTSTASMSADFAFGSVAQATGGNCFAFGDTVTASGSSSVAIGTTCTAAGNSSWALGTGASTVHEGSVVWGDSQSHAVSDTAQDQFCLTFAGGYRFNLGSLNILTAGHGIAIAEGSNAKEGVSTLSSGTVTVSNTSVTSTSRIYCFAQDANTVGTLHVVKTPGTGFVITSSNSGDHGVVAWLINEVAV